MTVLRRGSTSVDPLIWLWVNRVLVFKLAILTYLGQPFYSCIQCMCSITHNTKNTQHLQPEEEFLLKETLESRHHIYNMVLCSNEVFVPGPTCIVRVLPLPNKSR